MRETHENFPFHFDVYCFTRPPSPPIFHYIPSIYTCHWHGALFMVLLLQLRCHFCEFKCWIFNIQSRQMYQGYRYSKLISTASKLRASGIIFMYSPSQWETTLQYNVVSHLLDTYIKSSLGLSGVGSIPSRLFDVQSILSRFTKNLT